jgi:hypothetical protein
MQEGFRYLRGHLDASRGIIATGVQAGEQVITRGQLRLAPGVKVAPEKS